MVRFRIECNLPFPRDQFWLIRDSASFFDFVVQDGLLKDLKATTPQYDEHGWGTRVQHYCPANVDCPNMLRAVVGDTLFEVSDEQRWNEKERPCHLQFFIKPSFLSGLSRTSGELSIENFSEPEDNSNPLEDLSDVTLTENGNETSSNDSITDPESSEASESSDMEFAESPEEYIERLPAQDKSKHVISGETKVSILTLGWFVERAIVHNLRMFYRKYPSTVARFRQKLYRDFADCDETVPVSVVVERFLGKERELEVVSGAKEQCPIDVVGFLTSDSERDMEESDEEDVEEEYGDWDKKRRELDDIPSPTRVDQDIDSLMLPS